MLITSLFKFRPFKEIAMSMSQLPKQSFLAFFSRLGASLKSSLGSEQRVHCGHVPQSSEMNQKQA